MRFGISATSWIFPKNLRTRLRPVNVCAISSLALSNRRARDDSPEGRHPSRPSGQPSRPLSYAIRPPAEPPCPRRYPAEIWAIPGVLTPESVALTSHLLEFHLGPGLLQLSLDLLRLVLAHAFLDGLGRAFDQILGLLEAQTGERAHLLDDLDLLLADGGEHGGELGLLFGRSRGGSATGSSRDGHRGRGGDAPFLLQHFRQVGGLEHREFGEVVDESLQISHWTSLCVRTGRVCDGPHAASLLAA